MHFCFSQRGQSLMEILFAIAIFTIGVVTIGYLIFDAFVSARYGDEYTQARLLAQEGIEIFRALQDDDFSQLIADTYGVVEEGGVWTLVTSPNVIGKFTRSVEIIDVDEDTKDAVSLVTWISQGNTERSVRLGSRFTNWRQTGGLQEHLEVRTEYTNLTASGTELSGIEVSNNNDESLTITGLSLMWEGPARITAVNIDGSEVFPASSSPAISEEYIDTVDYILGPYSGFRTIEYIRFDSSVESRNVVITFFLGDGTHRYVYVTP